MYAKISDVINRLEVLKEKHGDLIVCCAEIFGGGYGEIELSKLEDVVKHLPKHFPFPECVSITL